MGTVISCGEVRWSDFICLGRTSSRQGLSSEPIWHPLHSALTQYGVTTASGREHSSRFGNYTNCSSQLQAPVWPMFVSYQSRPNRWRYRLSIHDFLLLSYVYLLIEIGVTLNLSFEGYKKVTWLYNCTLHIWLPISLLTVTYALALFLSR